MRLKNNFVKLFITVLFFSFGTFAQGNQRDSLRVLLIGNSFSGNATQYLPELTAEAGYSIVIEKAAIGGASLKKHCDLVALSEKEPKNHEGKPYNGKSLKEVLSGKNWDIVSIQQVSWLSGDANTYRPYAQQLYNLIKELQPDAKVVMLRTWAYRNDSKDFTQISENLHAKNSKEMWQNLRGAYKTIASELGIEVVPVGDAFRKVSSNRRWIYKADSSFDETKALYTELPNQEHSLHNGFYWNDEKELRFDTHHANDAGRFLGSLVWYAFLFKESPRKLDFVPENVPENFANYLKKIAWKVTEK